MGSSFSSPTATPSPSVIRDLIQLLGRSVYRNKVGRAGALTREPFAKRPDFHADVKQMRDVRVRALGAYPFFIATFRSAKASFRSPAPFCTLPST